MPPVESPSEIPYRPEIDGLRALAVSAVMVFHLRESWLPGGFLGVDVFLVVSGFLITSLVRSQQSAGVFTMGGFWRRRIRRLYPALAVLVAAVLVAGALVMTDPPRGKLVAQAIAALLSYENVWLLRHTGGYWEPGGLNLPLLHVWSLSLEEQFYLLHPLVLLAVAALRGARAAGVLLVLLVASLVFPGVARWDAESRFYLLPARAWEFLCGAVLALALEGRPRVGGTLAAVVQSAALACIVASFFAIERKTATPGGPGLVPCLATVALLATAAVGGPAHRLLRVAPLVGLGRASYSVYLWHWPVIVFLTWTSTTFRPVSAILASLAFGFASHRWIEQPFRRGVGSERWLALASVVAAGFATLLMLRTPPLVPPEADLDAMKSWAFAARWNAEPALRSGRAGRWSGIEAEDHRPVVAIVGDSQVAVLGDAVEARLEPLGIRLLSQAVMAHSFSGGEESRLLRERRTTALRRTKPCVVVVGWVWNYEPSSPSARAELRSFLEELSQVAGQVIVLGQLPYVTMPWNYARGFGRFMTARAVSGDESPVGKNGRNAASDARVREVVRSTGRGNVSFLPLESALLDDDGRPVLRSDGRLLWFDHVHVNETGARRIVDRVLGAALDEAVKDCAEGPRGESLRERGTGGFPSAPAAR